MTDDFAVYRIDELRLQTYTRAAQHQFDTDIDSLRQYRILVEVEMFACTDCGVRSPDRAHFTDGMVCCACQPTHAEWYKEH